jgi:ketosteroid isomerase-like protein
MTETEKIHSVLGRFALGWRKANAAILKATWDQDFADSIYQASEREAPLYGYAAIAAYYDEATSMYPITSMEISNVRIQLYGGVALAFCEIAIGFKVGASEYLVHPRASFLLKKQADGEWLTQHYHESIKYEVPKS